MEISEVLNDVGGDLLKDSVKHIFTNFVKPRINALSKKYPNVDKISTNVEYLFIEYYNRTYHKLLALNTLVFRNQQKILTDLYIPLHITQKRDNTHHKIDCFPEHLRSEYANILITDTAGMGKSTILKMMFLFCVDSKNGIPIFIELRKLNNKNSLIDEILNQISSINQELNRELFLDLVNEGGFIFFLDGYDEIAYNEIEQITTDLQNFISKAKNSSFFLTSRPESKLASFANFREFTIDPLKIEEAYELLEKYDDSGVISKLLIEKLKERILEIEDFLENPLLTTLLYTAFEHKQSIPLKKHIFYRQVYDAFFEDHDLSKGDSFTHKKYSKLSIDDFHTVLRYVGINSLKTTRISHPKDELLTIIENSMDLIPNLKFNASDFLQDLLKTVPLFVLDGQDIKWSHKSFQEYFAAQFIYRDANSDKNKILLSIYNSENIEKYLNVLDLFYDMDQASFRQILLKEFLVELKNYHKLLLESFPNIDKTLIKKRTELTFVNYFVLFGSYSKREPQDMFEFAFNELIKKKNKYLRNFEGLTFTQDDKFILVKWDSSKAKFLTFLNSKKQKFIHLVGANEQVDFATIELCAEQYEMDTKFLIDKDENSILNLEDHFEMTNQLLVNILAANSHILLDEALEELELIITEEKKIKDSGLFSGF